MRPITAVVVHHSASPQDWTLERISDAHKDRGFSEVSRTNAGYHYVVEADPVRVRLGRAINQVGAHAKGNNSHSIGVCVIGSYEGEESPSPEQWAAATSLCADLLRQFPEAKLYGHKERGPTLCPGFDPEAFRADTYTLLEDR